MNNNKLLENDEFGILPLEDKRRIPYVSFTLTERQYEKIRGLKPMWYEINGSRLLKIKDENGNLTGECAMFLVFVEQGDE